MKKRRLLSVLIFILVIVFLSGQLPVHLPFVQEIGHIAAEKAADGLISLNSALGLDPDPEPDPVIKKYDQLCPPYYRNKLSAPDKAIYDRIKLALANPDKKILAGETISDQKYETIIWFVWADNPYISQDLINSLSGGAIPLITYVSMDYNSNDYAKLLDRADQALTKAQQIAAQVPAGWSDYQKVNYLHDYLIAHCIPNVEDKGDPLNNEAYGALIRGKAMCEGYTNAMQLLCDLLGIENTVVSYNSFVNTKGEEVEGHTWNVIKMDGAFYHVDLGSDDSIADIGTTPCISYQYFGLTTAEINRLHGVKISRTFDGYMPDCTATADNYFVRNALVFGRYDRDTVAKAMADNYNEELADDNILTSVKFTNAVAYQSAVSDSENLSRSILYYLRRPSGEFGTKPNDATLVLEEIIYF